MRISIVCNSEDRDLGLLGENLGDAIPKVNYLFREEFRNWSGIGSTDFFIHLGSSWSVYWDSVRRSVDAEVALMREASRRGVPILGVCFGAQVLSHAFGGIVERGKKTEIGWCDVVAPSANSILAGKWMQWHYDSFSAPVDFEVLAINDAGVQAIRRGRSLGVQFHPEATEAIVTNWIGGDGAGELAAAGITPSELLEETRRETLRTLHATRNLTNWFLEDVSQSPVGAWPGN